MNPTLYGVIARHSKSFSLASRLLDRTSRDDVAVLYAWCRRADDEVDLAPVSERRARVERLYGELAAVYAGEVLAEPVLAEFQSLVRRRGIPRDYPLALLDGMRSDLGPVRIATVAELIVYCYRVAGVVGLMLCHVFGLSDARAKENAAHLGIAMQLTNICRDVREDAEGDRRYLPSEVLAGCVDARGGVRVERAVERLLALAARYYRSADAGFYALPFRAALAARAARHVYAAIGGELAARGFDALAGRVRVALWKKLALVVKAVLQELTERSSRRLLGRAFQPESLGSTR